MENNQNNTTVTVKNNKVCTFIVLTMIIYLVVVDGLFAAGCIKFLKCHTFWEMITSPVQFWGQPVCLIALAIAVIVNGTAFIWLARRSK